jgi:hypothetical protein
MPSNFDLIITADYPSRTAELRLLDEHSVQLAYRQTDFKTITVSRQQGLFDLRNYLRHYVEPGREAASIAEIGVCIAEEVLGADIFRTLAASGSQRTLRIQLPGAIEADNHLAAALARVPWESRNPLSGSADGGEPGTAVRSSGLAAGRGSRPHGGASCPLGSLARGVCGLVVGDDPTWGRRLGSLPVGRRPLPAPPPPAATGAVVHDGGRPRRPSSGEAAGGRAAAPGLPCLMLADARPRRQSASSRPAPATAAVLQPRTPHAAGLASGATA